MGFHDRAIGLAALLSVGCGAAGHAPGAAETRAAPRAVASVAPLEVAPVPLRRLTREEYNNTVRDLLADTTRPGDAFPPDEVVGGFESNTIAPVTPTLVQRYMDAAEALAAAAVTRLDSLAPCAAGTPQLRCAEHFVDRFGLLAYRRPLEASERSDLLALYSEKEKRSGYAGGIQLVLQSILESPQFLYRVEPARGRGGETRPLTGYEVATRLSFFLWASTPDQELLDAAAAGKLDAAPEIERQARRLLADPRAVDGVRSFHRQWLDLDELEAVSKDAALGRTFTPELKSAMVEETLRFAADAVFAGGDTVKTLLTSQRSFVNAPLAALYGVPAPKQGFARVDLPAHQRSGLLSQASLMTLFANSDQTSPILRGKFVREKLLCQPIPPPPPNTAIAPPKIDPTLTTKQRFAQHRRDPSCASCHQLMDPIGFGFEHYDGIGAWRTVDGAFPVDAVGELTMTDDADGSFDGVRELGERLAASREVRHCIATQWFRFALGRGERDEDAPSIAAAYDAFAKSGFDVRELMIAIPETDAFRHARFEGGSEP